MANKVFKIGKTNLGVEDFDCVVTEFKPRFETLDTDKSGRAQSTGNMYRSVIGTYYNCTIVIKPKKNNFEEYDKLLKLLINAKINKGFLWVEIPYLQGTLTQEMYCTSVERPLKRKIENSTGENQRNEYGEMTISLIAKKKMTDAQLNADLWGNV